MNEANKIIYLDNAATTKILPEVYESMIPFLTDNYGNASSIHSLGYRSLLAIEESREKIADLIDCEANKIYFTSGATESNNWIITQSNINSIVTSQIEHDSIYITCQKLSEQKEVVYLKNDCFGNVSCDDLFHTLLSKNYDLVSIMYANNEIGTIQQINKIKRICEYSKTKFHTDATQALGHLPISIKKERINYLSASAHKLGGPKGIGILYSDEHLEPFMNGGHQENGYRAGTYNTPAIIGFGKACEIAKVKMKEEQNEINEKREYLMKKIAEIFEDCSFCNFHFNTCLPISLASCLSISFTKINGEELMLMLSDRGVLCNIGSACNSGEKVESRVLKAIGIPDDYINGTIRFSLNNDITFSELNYVVEELYNCVKYLSSQNT